MNFREDAVELIDSDFRDLSLAANSLAEHAVKLGSIGFGPSLFAYIAVVAAIYLLILDRTSWRTNILPGTNIFTALLLSYIFFSLPSIVFNFFRGEIGKWIALVAVVLRLFIPRHFPDWLEMPGALILLIVATPGIVTVNYLVGVQVCILIALYLLQEHIRAIDGYKNCFTKASGISNIVGMIILFLYPFWALVATII